MNEVLPIGSIIYLKEGQQVEVANYNKITKLYFLDIQELHIQLD